MKVTASIVAGLIMGTLLLPSSVYATTDCSITNTGPGSTNECIVRDKCDIDVRNDTDIDIDNSNNQGSSSGDGTTTGNTGGGGATTGDATNGNSTDIDLGVNNGTTPNCNPATTTTPPPTNGGGGQGGGESPGRVEGASTNAARQVQAPVGGVGAGAGGLTMSLLGASIVSAAVGARRLHKLSHVR